MVRPSHVHTARYVTRIALRVIAAALVAWTLLRAGPGLVEVLNVALGQGGGPAYAAALFVPSLFPAVVAVGLVLAESRLVRWLVPDPPRGICPACGYSLKDLRSPLCPECGTHLQPPPAGRV